MRVFTFCILITALFSLTGCNCDSQPKPADNPNAPYRAEVKNENGRPRLYVNGREMQPVVYGMSDIAAWRTWLPEPQKNIKFFAQEGVKIVLIDSELRHSWKQDGTVDISNIRKDIRGVLDVSPDAPVIVRIHINAPYWWTLENRDQVVEFGDGPWVDDRKTDDVRLIKNDQPRVMRISLASKKWLKESGEVLGKACRELASTPEGSRVIAFQIAGGLQGEWHQWGCVKHEPDFSKPMQERFREYLKQKYRSDAALQKAWGNPDVTIAGAKIPPLSERYKPTTATSATPSFAPTSSIRSKPSCLQSARTFCISRKSSRKTGDAPCFAAHSTATRSTSSDARQSADTWSPKFFSIRPISTSSAPRSPIR